MKSNRGVTALSMVIIVVIIIIILGFSLFSSKDLVSEGKVSKIYNEMSVVNNAMKQLSLEDRYLNTAIKDYKITDISEYNSHVDGKLNSSKTYYHVNFGDDLIDTSLKVVSHLKELLKVMLVMLLLLMDVMIYVALHWLRKKKNSRIQILLL